MKKFALLAFFAFSSALFAEESLQIFLTIQGTRNYQDYKYAINGISKIEGVSNLIETRVSQENISLKGSLSGNADTFLTDAQTLALDRFKFDAKKDDGKIEITLKGL